VRKFILSYIALFAFNLSFSQGTSPFYKVNPGQALEEVLNNEIRFLYPEFKMGLVLFRSGSLGSSKMNYNFLYRELLFINGEDTLALDKGEDIRHVVIENDTFYFRENEWIRQVASSGKVRLAEVKFLTMVDIEKIGAYGQEISGNSVDAYMVTTANMPRKLEANQVLTFAMAKNFYFGDRFDNYRLANKKNISNMFGNKCPGIEKYLESEKISYHSSSDMQKLFDFINRNLK
jgi:hypothetical protein